MLYCCFKWKEQENTIFFSILFLIWVFHTSEILDGNFVIAWIEKIILKNFRWFDWNEALFIFCAEVFLLSWLCSNINLMIVILCFGLFEDISLIQFIHPPTINSWIFLQPDDTHSFFKLEIHNNFSDLDYFVFEILSEAILTSKNFNSNCCAILWWNQKSVKKRYFQIKKFFWSWWWLLLCEKKIILEINAINSNRATAQTMMVIVCSFCCGR